jgi:hypothetical protein
MEAHVSSTMYDAFLSTVPKPLGYSFAIVRLLCLVMMGPFERSRWRGGRYASSKVAAVGFGRTVLATWRLG